MHGLTEARFLWQSERGARWVSSTRKEAEDGRERMRSKEQQEEDL